ncbi:apolipoprotein N-acyltransferase [Arcobacter vandammei]|uniref:apolipoprotein N-acyltransferase n=1 Tax=Arcobacter vandammei TaxID=2782243 RepID=UPI0018DFCFFB|nr:apolipoprotein N-acyltransferase [Arcobacter vandammei]
MFLLKTYYSNKINIIKGFITAFMLSAFIYLSHFGFEIKIINSVLGILAIYLLLTIPKKALLATGFFSGIFWCNWMAVSLQYYDLTYIFPLVLLGIGIVFAIIFYLFALFDNLIFRSIAIFIFTFISPFGFNWMKFELLFVDSYFSTSKIAFLLIVCSLGLFIYLKKFRFAPLFLLVFAFDFSRSINLEEPKINIQMPQMMINQDLKWQKEYVNDLIENNFKIIENAINEKKDLVVLPETAFAFILNRKSEILERLLELSYNIDIIVGSLYVENKEIFNASYHFFGGNYEVAKKVVLVPFGEEIPFPKFIVDIINNIFYGGASDYSKASMPTDFIVKGEKFRNAICYEATTDKIFENLNDTKYMIAISNNAWFIPSIEPTLQHLLLKYYSKKYKVMIFHIVNGSKNSIYKP